MNKLLEIKNIGLADSSLGGFDEKIKTCKDKML